ncbi:hypothetical protein FN846DRAFT_348382 [Sphaerosporella brunnea]|uniref:Uncharacterized protein n=1 Tax=Sphaerosporella brunnea TaxID=1250544 RepID=A0A5J5EKJ2_9PEZI|nr:hypothetical protein FN846DRAFT_348382 [Sphaerosporella brunnea]
MTDGDIYLDTAIPGLVDHLQHGYRNEENISDGEIFRNIRISHKESEIVNERFWWSRLSKTKKRDLQQLLKNPMYRAAFDSLVCIPSLCPGLKLGALHWFLTLKCDEEILRYLEWIRMAWFELLENDHHFLTTVDCSTVQALELRAPGLSKIDRREVCKLFEMQNNAEWKLSPGCSVESRARFRQNVLKAKDRIPSLNTFFDDLKYLEPLADAHWVMF